MASEGDNTNALQARIRELEAALALQHTQPQATSTTTSSAMKDLVERDRRFQYALTASRDGLWDWSIGTDSCYFSPGYWQLLGFSEPLSQANFQTIEQQLLHPEDRDAVLTELRTAIANHRTNLRLEHRMLTAKGETLWVDSRCVLVEPDSAGYATRCVGTISDITHDVTTNAALISAKAEAEQASKTKSQFLASMSHEIRTPMNAIIGLGHLLQDTPLDDIQRSYLGNMSIAADALLQTVNQVFDYAKLETGNITLEHSHFDLERVFERLSHQFESLGLAHNKEAQAVDINFTIGDDVPLFMRGDATRLNHIISHLVSNALQYSYSPEILIKAELVKCDSNAIRLRFSITDYGRGMSPQTLERLRQDLHRQPHRTIGNTNGFGLQICKLLVKLMNGTLELTSLPNKSTTFSFTANFEKSHIGARRINDSDYNCRALRLLVVDDNQLALDILSQSAGKLVDHVDTACDAHVAGEKIRRAEQDDRPYDLVLIDYKMPIKNGLAAARDIKTACDLNKKPRIFLVSSLNRDEIFLQTKNTQQTAQPQGSELIDDFLSKPVSPSRLFDAICKALPECLQHNQTTEPEAFEQLQGRHVLLVEDNIVNQQVATGMLRKKGVQVTTANNGQEAVQLIESGRQFDAVLMDIEMPFMNGIEATERIRANELYNTLPIIALTAQAMHEDRDRCLAAGMDDYISKPIKPKSLYEVLCEKLISPV
ncbi:PAS domain-containing hybrid sensor histidine kinase/response regulator [Gilvimarinus polysaccharolyticus]|uniref:PAS domain-containing hybrid sensor histidine kinase/response regulator n=1 Tax=Gilvimarinus polysaccharolyticus TaxID=863921 RepID=UPI000673575A|nr:PAS domain-containing hybrid sensor histidine kinase/response regulator [Gilvimarinus polysaccharolyticus]